MFESSELKKQKIYFVPMFKFDPKFFKQMYETGLHSGKIPLHNSLCGEGLLKN